MTLCSLLICDDSNMARKQLLRALPADWPVTIEQAANGLEAMTILRLGQTEVLLLDLTMPEMDGYEVLAALKAEGLSCKVIVVSGDVQAQAVERVMELGASKFYSAVLADKQHGRKKPIHADFVGIELPNRFVFGYGMDIEGAWRNLPAIYAAKA